MNEDDTMLVANAMGPSFYYLSYSSLVSLASFVHNYGAMRYRGRVCRMQYFTPHFQCLGNRIMFLLH